MLRLREIRKDRKMTQEALASLVGVSQGYISSLEDGSCSPGFDVLIRLSKALNCTIDEMIVKEESA